MAALFALVAEWRRTDIAYETRVQHLFGEGVGGLNGVYLLNPDTIAHDTVANQVFGGSSLDWYWMSIGSTADQLSGFEDDEVMTLR